jgi:hypothetical protein
MGEKLGVRDRKIEDGMKKIKLCVVEKVFMY